jgi:hypothetical protein
MTRDRIYGEDSAFSAWVRGNKLLPAAEIVATDTDLWIHRYKTHIDSIGVRNLQSLIMIEAKTRGAKPNSSQQDTLLKIHRTIANPRQPIYVKKQLIRNFGVAFFQCLALHQAILNKSNGEDFVITILLIGTALIKIF